LIVELIVKRATWPGASVRARFFALVLRPYYNVA